MRQSAPVDRARALALTGLFALTAACSSGHGSNDVPTVTSPSPTAAVGSSAPPSSRPPGAAAPAKLTPWKGCGTMFQCSTLDVPLDEHDAAAGTVTLSLTRTRATGPSSRRIGSLLVNPGGPGASAVDFLTQAYTDIPAAVRARFDLVAFDPRGVGHSAPVHCESTAELDRYFHLDPAPTDAAGVKAIDDGNRKLAAGCAQHSGRVLPHVSTVEAARDMDRVRAALGDQKLTYLGYSYGTSIGAAYLDRFPTRVRAMVLDGALDPTLSWDQLLAGQSKGFDLALKAFLADCQAKACAFRAATSGDLVAAYDRLAARVKAQPLPGDATRTVGAGEFSLGVEAGLYSKANGWPAIATALAEAQRGNGKILLALSDSYLERSPSGYANVSEANFAVNCIDRPWPRHDAPYLALAKQVGKNYPRFGPSIALSGLGCAVWPVRPVSTPRAVRGKGSPPIVVVGTTRDPATPYVWAQGLAKQLASGVLLTHEGDGHTSYRTSAPACLTDPVNRYLLTAIAPPATTC